MNMTVTVMGLASFDLAFLGAILVMGIGCVFEVKARRFPNWLSLPMLLIILGWRLLTSQPPHWLALFVAVWGYFFWAWRRGFMGAGDAKGLMVLSGLWPTWQTLLAFMACLIVTLLVFGLGTILFSERRNLAQVSARLTTLPAHYLSSEAVLSKREVLLVPAVIGAVLFYLLWGRTWIV
jgi:Flp pilus assembly protein protease CpaA